MKLTWDDTVAWMENNLNKVDKRPRSKPELIMSSF